MRLNMRLKMLFEDYIRSIEVSSYKSIEGIPCGDIGRVLEYFVDIIEDDILFIYKEGTTKFNSNLTVDKKESIVDFLRKNYKVYSIDSLDFILVGEYEGFDGKEEVRGFDIDCSGKFEDLLVIVSKEFDFPIVAH